MAGQLTGVLLVGGASRRFGSPKALAIWGNQTFAEWEWDRLKEAFDHQLAVGKVADRLDLPFPLIDDGTDVRAPLAGVVAGVRAASTEVCVFTPVDALTNPFGDGLKRLAEACARGADAAVSQFGPLPVALRKRALPILEARLARGDLRLRDALDELDAHLVEFSPGEVMNINTPRDLERLYERQPGKREPETVKRAREEQDFPALVATLGDRYMSGPLYSWPALKRAGSAAHEALRAGLDHPNELVRGYSATLLLGTAEPRPTEIVLQLLSEVERFRGDHFRMWELAALEAAEHRVEASFGALVDALNSGDPDAQECAAEALAMLGDVRAVQPLAALLKEVEIPTSDYVADALNELGGPEAEAALAEWRKAGEP